MRPDQRARPAQVQTWHCVLEAWQPQRAGRLIVVSGYQTCAPQPRLSRLRICVQVEHKLLFITWSSNVRCAMTIRAFPNAGFVSADISARCRSGSHTYRGVIFAYGAPPPGYANVKSASTLDTRC